MASVHVTNPVGSLVGSPVFNPDSVGAPAGAQDIQSETIQHHGLDFKALTERICNRWRAIGMLGLIVLLSACVYYVVQEPIYRSTIRLEMINPGEGALGASHLSGRLESARMLETARLKLMSRQLALRIVDDLNLLNNNRFRTAVLSDSLSASDPETERQLAARFVQEQLVAHNLRNSSLIELQAYFPDAELARSIAHQAAVSYQTLVRQAERDHTFETLSSLSTQVADAGRRLETSEQSLVDFARKSGLSASGHDETLLAQAMARLNHSLVGATEDRLKWARWAALVRNGQGHALPQVLQNQLLTHQREELARLTLQYRKLSAHMRPLYPQMRSLQRQIDEGQRLINQEIERQEQSVIVRHGEAVELEKNLREELATLERTADTKREQSVQLSILNRQVEANRSQYGALVDRMNRLRSASQQPRMILQIVEKAIVPQYTVSPNLVRIGLVSGLIFLCLTALYLWLIDLFDNRLTSAEQVERDLALPLLASLPEHARDGGDPLFEEACRSLRTALQFSSVGEDNGLLAVTSAGEGEGKSTIALQVARQYAALGKSVLLIDADMRNPNLHQQFEMSHQPGLSNILTSVIKPSESGNLFRSTGIPALTLLSSGPRPPSPADLLASGRMKHLLALCQNRFDMVILDTPPAESLSDSVIVGRQVDAVLMVVCSRKALRKSVINTVKHMRAVGVQFAGIALNNVISTAGTYPRPSTALVRGRLVK